MSNRFLPRRNEDTSPTTAKARKRVTNACARCRKYKARCDSFRPCALCRRNNAVCEPRRSLGESSKKAASVSNSTDTEQRQSPRFHGTSSSPASITPSTPFTRNRPMSRNNSEPQSHISHREEATHGSASDGSRLEEQDDSTSAIAIARKIYQLRRDGVAIHTTSAIPDGDSDRTSLSANQTHGQSMPIAVILKHRFPDPEQVRMLMEDFFDSVHWFSLVIYAPTFQTLLSSVQDGYAHQSDAPFLLLLSMVLSMASWYRAKQADNDEYRNECQQWSDELRGIVEARILQLMGHPSLLATQTCILLGSHHVYHGQPNLSFSLLGATIKMAHTLALHRHPTGGDGRCIEERKRVWWTIYTWDRFASISHCRPLSINEKDCDVGMPEDFTESSCSGSPAGQDTEPVCYSRYQKELSTLYVTASPALEEILGCISTQSSRQNFESKYATLVGQITTSLMEWHRQLPSHLNWTKARLQHLDESMESCTRATRAHALQSLALQMTFDNLLIVLYRPCLARHIDHLPMSYSRQGQSRHDPDTSLGTFFGHVASSSAAATEIITGTEHWCTAALRTTQLTEHSRLIQLATNSHLMVFMAMNMFHAAVVLIILALTDPLCDDTQTVKRSVTRVLHLQRALAKHSTFSKQTSDVLKLLIHRILQREQEAILGSDDLPLADVHTHTSSAEKGRTAWYSRTMSQVNTSDNMPSADATSFLYSDSQNGTFGQSSEDQNLANLSIVQRLDDGLTDVRQALNMSRNPSTTQQVHPAPTSFDTTMPELGYLQAGWQLPPQPDYMDGVNTENQPDYMAEHTDSLFWLWNLRRDINH